MNTEAQVIFVRLRSLRHIGSKKRSTSADMYNGLSQWNLVDITFSSIDTACFGYIK